MVLQHTTKETGQSQNQRERDMRMRHGPFRWVDRDEVALPHNGALPLDDDVFPICALRREGGEGDLHLVRVPLEGAMPRQDEAEWYLLCATWSR